MFGWYIILSWSGWYIRSKIFFYGSHLTRHDLIIYWIRFGSNIRIHIWSRVELGSNKPWSDMIHLQSLLPPKLPAMLFGPQPLSRSNNYSLESTSVPALGSSSERAVRNSFFWELYLAVDNRLCIYICWEVFCQNLNQSNLLNPSQTGVGNVPGRIGLHPYPNLVQNKNFGLRAGLRPETF